MSGATRIDPHKPRLRLQVGFNYHDTQTVVRTLRLHTVCESARCPNIYECWENRTATIMILGDICTRACGFCAVRTGRPQDSDPEEPLRTARAVRSLELRHVVITSVDRDDLKADFGAAHWAATILAVRRENPECRIEVLTPDFQGVKTAQETVFRARPDIFGHNLECVERISRRVRRQARWRRSLELLRRSAQAGLVTKTGLMVGLGETPPEVLEVMRQAREAGVSMLTIGQYLQPTRRHLSVARYVEPSEFRMYKDQGLRLGFEHVAAGALVRSSYLADQQARHVKGNT